MEALPPYIRGTTTTVRWSGSDTGVAGNMTYDIQYRVGGTDNWVDWKIGTTETKASFTGAPGQTVFFRVRGRDDAGNIEAWRGVPGDASTSFYTWNLVGRLVDDRGTPLPGAALTLTPTAITSTTTDPFGNYKARLISSGNHTAAPSQAGYLSPPVTQLAMDRDRAFSPYLLPLDNQIQNGGFEDSAGQLTSWVISGTLSTSVTNTVALTGARAAQIGQPCAAPCLTAPEIAGLGAIDVTTASSWLDMVVDDTGTVHVVWPKLDLSSIPPVQRLYYGTRAPNGTWSAPGMIAGGAGFAPKLVIDAQQTLHALWIAPGERLNYSQHPSGGAWSTPVDLAPAISNGPIDLAVDRSGRVYAVYSCGFAIDCPDSSLGYYRVRTPDGIWQPPRAVPSSDVSAAIEVDDRLHLVWELNGRGFSAVVQGDGALAAPIPFGEGYQVYRPQAVVDTNGLVQIVWVLNQEGYYVAQLPDGTFALPIALTQVDGSNGPPQLAIDSQGTLYLANAITQNDYGIYFRTKPALGEWTQPTKLYSTTYGTVILATDRFGRAHILRSGPVDQQTFAQQLYYQTTTLAPGPDSASLAQTITIPADAHKPTLAFAYALTGVTPANGSQIDVTIGQGLAAQKVFTATIGDGWSHAAIDMQPWLGETVQMTLTLRHASGAPNAAALIDDISLGSWLTPVIQQVSPSEIDDPTVPTDITITGDNYIDTPSVRLGQTTLDAIQLVDEHTIRATIPAGLPAGVYSLWVTNPGGQQALLSDVRLGKQVYLPLVVN
jgi:hypothetical protein